MSEYGIGLSQADTTSASEYIASDNDEASYTSGPKRDR
jgi:hypothetical protein